jgi:hypothetical protein
MTAQMPDEIEFNTVKYNIAGVKGKDLFKPEKYNIRPDGLSTACWRGHICHYKIVEDRLILDSLEVFLDEGERPILQGREPREQSFLDGEGFCDWRYDNLNLEIDFSGRLLLARDFIDDLYVHLGHHPAWKYVKVLELTFRHGRLIAHDDVSGRIAEIRKEEIEKGIRPGSEATEKERDAWMDAAFSLDYDL